MAWCSGGVWGQTVLAYQPRQWCDCIYAVSLSLSLSTTYWISIASASGFGKISERTFEGLSGMLDGWGDQHYISRQRGKWAADARYCGCGKPNAKGLIVELDDNANAKKSQINP